jgi:hypothetical protein
MSEEPAPYVPIPGYIEPDDRPEQEYLFFPDPNGKTRMAGIAVHIRTGFTVYFDSNQSADIVTNEIVNGNSRRIHLDGTAAKILHDYIVWRQIIAEDEGEDEA